MKFRNGMRDTRNGYRVAVGIGLQSSVCSLRSKVYGLKSKVYHRQVTAGFTMLEMLVVIAIIGVLAAIIIPTAGRVQENARMVQCASNLKQLHTAAMGYMSDRGRLPYHADTVSYEQGEREGDGGTARSGWVASIDSGSVDAEGHAWWYDRNDGDGLLSVTRGTLFSYVGEVPDVYVCPTMARYARKEFNGDKKNVTRSYGINPRAADRNISDFDGASRTFLFADQGLILMDDGENRNYLNAADDGPNSGSLPDAGDEYWQDHNYYYMRYNMGVDGSIDYNRDNNSQKEWIGAYHGSQAHEPQSGSQGGVGNAVFLDGHVEQVMYGYTDYIGDGDWEDGAPIDW